MSDNPTDRKPRHLGEDLFILLSVLAIWPSILNWDHPAYDLLMYGALIGLVLIFLRRLRRFRRVREEFEQEPS